MRRLLVISSHVAYGAVGLAATIAPLQRAQIEVAALPTVVLSNHPGHAHFAGTKLEPALLEDMIAALDANGWLGTFDGIFSGYLPSAVHVAWAARVVERMRVLNPSVVYFCDPILGDDPAGLYIDLAAAEAIRDTLVPLADVVLPNRFELAWLSGIAVSSADDAVTAARALVCNRVCTTSIPNGPTALADVLVSSGDVFACGVEKLESAPHGTGDLFAGFLASALMEGAADDVALGLAVGGVRHALDVSRGSDRLLLSKMDWTNGIRAAQVERLS